MDTAQPPFDPSPSGRRGCASQHHPGSPHPGTRHPRHGPQPPNQPPKTPNFSISTAAMRPATPAPPESQLNDHTSCRRRWSDHLPRRTDLMQASAGLGCARCRPDATSRLGFAAGPFAESCFQLPSTLGLPPSVRTRVARHGGTNGSQSALGVIFRRGIPRCFAPVRSAIAVAVALSPTSVGGVRPRPGGGSDGIRGQVAFAQLSRERLSRPSLHAELQRLRCDWRAARGKGE